MTRTALFIDLPNFYGHLLKTGIEEPEILREYVREWLDLDLLANRNLLELGARRMEAAQQHHHHPARCAAPDAER